MPLNDRETSVLNTADTRPMRRAPTMPGRRPTTSQLLIGGMLVLVVVVVILSLSDTANPSALAGANSGSVLVLALPAFLAGMLSFLSPCCLPVLSAYVAYTVQTQRDHMVGTTVAFFLGLATTMVVFGAVSTALSQLLFQHLPTLTLIGGLVIIGFGIMSILGKGFAGVQLTDRPTAGAAGAYLYGATFALGWTACVGPILGALLTLLATQGIAVLQGAVLAFIYALGLGAPLIALATFLSRRDRNSRIWRIMRGRGFEIKLGFTTLYLHTTSIASGVLLIAIGVLLATGQLATLSQAALQSPLTRWVLNLDSELQRIFLGR
jgi:cytochrome c-type biogenesis protein